MKRESIEPKGKNARATKGGGKGKPAKKEKRGGRPGRGGKSNKRAARTPKKEKEATMSGAPFDEKEEAAADDVEGYGMPQDAAANEDPTTNATYEDPEAGENANNDSALNGFDSPPGKDPLEYESGSDSDGMYGPQRTAGDL